MHWESIMGMKKDFKKINVLMASIYFKYLLGVNELKARI